MGCFPPPSYLEDFFRGTGLPHRAYALCLLGVRILVVYKLPMGKLPMGKLAIVAN
ncbi:MAG: hypothetical protein ACK55Z_15510 [bacterium]